MIANRHRNVLSADLLEQRVLRMPWSGCWIWEGARSATGYGLVSVSKKPVYTHRASWLVHNGEIPAKRLVLHRCDERLCINPGHLFLGTHRENSVDMVEKGRNVSHRIESGLCKRGHPLVEKVPGLRKGRHCIVCRDSWRARKAMENK